MATITAELRSGTKVTISNGRHTWGADEPPEVKGTDTAPNPYELLLGALAACACITLSLYSQHKGIAIDTIRTSYEFDRIHADDCKACDETAEGMLDRIQSNVSIAGDFDEAQRKRLGQVAERCPVHKTLSAGIHIVDRVEFT